MKPIQDVDELQIGKEYYLHYDGDKIKAHVCDINHDIIYFSNIMTLQNKGYHKQIPYTNYTNITRPIAYTYQDITDLQTDEDPRPSLQVCYLAVRHVKYITTRKQTGFYSQQEIYYTDPEDPSVLVNFYIIHHGETAPLEIYEPMRDKIIEMNQMKTLQMVMDTYTVPYMSQYTKGLL